MAKRTPSDIELDLIFIGVDPADQRVARSLIAGGLSTPFRDASAGVMVTCRGCPSRFAKGAT
jgi:hypothetical protein